MQAKSNQNPFIDYLLTNLEQDLIKLDQRINEIKEKSIKEMVNDFIKKSSAKKKDSKQEEEQKKQVDTWLQQHKRLKYLKIFSTVAYGLQRDYFVEEKIRQRYQWLFNSLKNAPSQNGIIQKMLSQNQCTNQEIYERFKVWMYGIIIPFPQKISQLHQLIIENNSKLIEHLLLNNQIHDLEEADELGFTPLALAVRLQKEAIVAVLLSYGANPRLMNIIGLQNPLQWAVTSSQNDNLIRMLLKGTVMMEQIGFEQQRLEGEKILSEIEDFSFEMHWWLDSSWIPFCKKLAPSDQYEIFKKGNNFRIN